MNQRIIATGAALAIVAGCASAQEAPSTPGWLEKDFSELVEMFEGHWEMIVTSSSLKTPAWI